MYRTMSWRCLPAETIKNRISGTVLSGRCCCRGLLKRILWNTACWNSPKRNRVLKTGVVQNCAEQFVWRCQCRWWRKLNRVARWRGWWQADEMLKDLRKKVAKKKPAALCYFSESSLEDMATMFPTTTAELEKISGGVRKGHCVMANPLLNWLPRYVEEKMILPARWFCNEKRGQ